MVNGPEVLCSESSVRHWEGDESVVCVNEMVHMSLRPEKQTFLISK